MPAAGSPLDPERCRALGVPAAQLGLMRGADRSVWCHGAGPGTPFHAGSLAKVAAAALVLDAGLDLDVPVAPWGDTLRALMGHTTGRPNVLPDGDEPLEAFVDRVGAMPLAHEPGRYSYCNAGWSLVDLELERRTGRGFEALAAGRLGLQRFGPPPDGAAGHRVAGPGQAPQPAPGFDMPAASAAGARWWTTADELLDLAAWLLRHGDPRQLEAHAAMPGRTVADAWGLGWALWDREDHRAAGWAGFTPGHRAFLRVFPDHEAALVLLTNAAGPLFGGAGGGALFDEVAPACLELLGVPALPAIAADGPAVDARDLAGRYGPAAVAADDDGTLLLSAPPLGLTTPLRHERLHATTYVAEGAPPGGMPIAFDDDDDDDDGWLYLGPLLAGARTGPAP